MTDTKQHVTSDTVAHIDVLASTQQFGVSLWRLPHMRGERAQMHAVLLVEVGTEEQLPVRSHPRLEQTETARRDDGAARRQPNQHVRAEADPIPERRATEQLLAIHEYCIDQTAL